MRITKQSGSRGLFQSIEKGRESNVTCACHWTVNVAASKGHTKLYADAYSVAPSGIFVPSDSAITGPADLAGVPISVGYQSGSHYSTIQALEQYLPRDQIKLSFEEGMLFQRLELFLAGKSPAAALFSGPYYLAEQLGFRKILDNTFMIAAMINGKPEPDDVRKYFRALRRAQCDIDLRPDLFTHFYKNEFPEHLHAKMDTRRWGPGERIVFERYSKEMLRTSSHFACRTIARAVAVGFRDCRLRVNDHQVRAKGDATCRRSLTKSSPPMEPMSEPLGRRASWHSLRRGSLQS